MSEKKKPTSLVDEVFGPEGPVFDGPKSIGRRKYDQTFWFIRMVKDLGFPIAVAWYLLSRLMPTIDKLDDTLNRETRMIGVLVCKVDPPSCARALDAQP